MPSWEYITTSRRSTSQWSPPIPPFIKVNFTAIYGNCACLVVIARNDTTDPIFVCTEIIEDSNSLIAEARALSLAAKSVVVLVDEGFKFIFCEGMLPTSSIPSRVHQSLPTSRLNRLFLKPNLP